MRLALIFPFVIYGVLPERTSSSILEYTSDWIWGSEIAPYDPDPFEDQIFDQDFWDSEEFEEEDDGSVRHRFSEFNPDRPETMAIQEWTRVYVITQKPGPYRRGQRRARGKGVPMLACKPLSMRSKRWFLVDSVKKIEAFPVTNRSVVSTRPRGHIDFGTLRSSRTESVRRS